MTINKDFALALIAATSRIEGAIKDSRNPHFKTNYADLSSVIQAIKEPLAGTGVTFLQMPQISDGSARVETFALHISGEMLSLGVVDVPVNKKDAQGYGSALTYARRYGLATAFGVPSIDDDGNAAVRSKPQQPQQKYYYRIPQDITDEQRRFFESRGVIWNDLFEAYESPIDLGAKLADKRVDPNTGEYYK